MTPQEEIKGLVVGVGTAFEEFKTTHEKSLKERDALTDDKLKKVAEDLTTQHEKGMKLIDELATKMNRSSLTNGYTDHQVKENDLSIELQKHVAVARGRFKNDAQYEPKLDEYRAYCKAFNRYARLGENVAGAENSKTLQEGVDPDGGYFILPPQISARVITKYFETSPMRKLATIENISTDTLEIYVDIDEATVANTTEQGTRSSTATPQAAKKSIVAHEDYAYPTATLRQLEDGAFDMEAWLSRKIGDKLGRFEATNFISGSGVNKPRGILTYPSGTSWNQVKQVTTGTSGVFTYTGLLKIITALKEPYQGNAQWLIQRQSMAGIMGLTDGSSRLIFQPILFGNFNETPLLGYKINYATDMAAVGAGALSAALGDWAQAYTIVDRVGISTIRDNVTTPGFVKFHVRRRVGGDVTNFEAFKLQVLT